MCHGTDDLSVLNDRAPAHSLQDPVRLVKKITIGDFQNEIFIFFVVLVDFHDAERKFTYGETFDTGIVKTVEWYLSN